MFQVLKYFISLKYELNWKHAMIYSEKRDLKIFIIIDQLIRDHFEFIVDKFGQCENGLISIDFNWAATAATGITETAILFTGILHLSCDSNIGTELLGDTVTTIENVWTFGTLLMALYSVLAFLKLKKYYSRRSKKDLSSNRNLFNFFWNEKGKLSQMKIDG